MLNLAIMPGLKESHIEELCQDAIEQQRTGVSTHALFMMYFNPIGDPPYPRAEEYCKIYDKYRAILDKAGAKHGILVQSTMGHIRKPAVPHKFQDSISLVNGEPRLSTCCPLDKNFRAYMKEQMKILASHKPSIIMIDDDIGLIYKNTRGCACPLHMAEFNRRAGTQMTREELYAHTQGNTELDKKYTDIYVKMIGDSLVDFVKEMREGIDEIDPTIQGAVSGICPPSGYLEFSDLTSKAFAGKGNRPIVRINNGAYTMSTTRFLTSKFYRAALIKKFLNNDEIILINESDTCPHNRYSTNASLIHAHFVGSILEGAKGSKQWFTRGAYEPNAGKAYRKIFAKHHKMHDVLANLADQLKPIGCKMPLTMTQNYPFKASETGITVCPWGGAVLERLGLPLFYGDGDGVAFVDDLLAKRLTDEEVLQLFKGPVVLSGGAANTLNERGFNKYIGVTLRKWEGVPVSGEMLYGNGIAMQVGYKEIVPNLEGAQELSYAFNKPNTETTIKLFPTSTKYVHPYGGTTYVFCGTPDTQFAYYEAFSFLNETRKNQFINIIKENNCLPIYYTEDLDVYIRAGYLPSGEMMCALFNLSLDVMEDIPLYVQNKPTKVEMLNSDGERVPLNFTYDGDTIRIEKTVGVLEPVILFLS